MRGSIVKRAKDSYTLIIPYQDPTTGRRKQHWETVRGTKREADGRLGELQRQANAGTLTRPARATVAEYLRAWLTDYCEGHVRATTLRGYRGVIERYIVPHLGGVPLSSLRPEQVQRLYADLLRSGGKDGRGISSLTVQHAHRALSEALGHAVKLGTLGRNVAAQVTPPRVEAQEVQPPSLEAVQSVLEAAKTGPYHLALLLCLVTGARRSEVCGLQWGDLNWKAGTVRIERGIHIVKGQGLITQPPKTRNSRRVVALPPSVVLALRARLGAPGGRSRFPGSPRGPY